jgi:tRNA dimethylallyltransferase
MSMPLIVIVGPTASGKSDLAMRIAERHNGEIICADSRTVYRGMDIGTAKPSDEDRAKIPHHLLDIVEPNESFSAADFKRLASAAIADIKTRNKLPILVGGTGLYVDAVIFDYQFGEPADPALRAKLFDMTVEELQHICRRSYIDIPMNDKNKRHLIRAIELGGLPKRTDKMILNIIVVGLTAENDTLRKRILLRAGKMVEAGIIGEIQLLARRYGWESEAMKANIYRVFRGVVEASKSVEEATEEFVRSDMALAKRQRTWFKRNPAIIWGTAEELEKRLDDYIRAAS